MSLFEQTVWWILAGVGLTGSALYSGLETGAYSLNRVRLHVRQHQGDRAARRLVRLVEDRSRLLGTILIGNNLANYLGTSALGVIFAGYGWSDTRVIFLNIAIVTPMLFVFGETLPKDLFAAFSDRLMYRLAWFLKASAAVFKWTGMLAMVQLVTRSVIRISGGKSRTQPLHPRRLMNWLVRETVGLGLLSEQQSQIIDRVLAMTSRRVMDEMTPWNRVQKIHDTAATDELWRRARQSERTRYPIVNYKNQPVGVLNIDHALRHPPEQCPPVRELMSPLVTLDRNLDIRTALRKLQAWRCSMAVVTAAHQHPVGVVTIKDLVEPITGELSEW